MKMVAESSMGRGLIMESALNNLRVTCARSVSDLEAIQHTSNSVSFGRFDQKSWKARLDQIARALETAGAMLCDWSRATMEPDPENVGKLVGEVERLVKHMKKFPSARGRAYLKSACEAAIATVNALERIATLLPRMNLTLIEAYQWNQTRRLKELAASPVEHLLVFWERWNAQLGDASDEIRRISSGELNVDETEPSMDEDEDDDDEEWMKDMVRKMTESEVAMAKECYSLVKLVRGLTRKVRSKCINNLGCDTVHEIQLIDELFHVGETLVNETDNLATAVFPVQDNLVIREMAIRLAREAQNLADLARMHSADAALQSWFENCYRQLDRLVGPVIERSPFR